MRQEQRNALSIFAYDNFVRWCQLYLTLNISEYVSGEENSGITRRINYNSF